MMRGFSSAMLSQLVSWILSPSSSSSSSSSSEQEEEEEEEEESTDNNTNESDRENDRKDNVEDEEKDHFLSSCDVDDNPIPVALAVPDAASPAVTVAFPAAATTAIVTRSKGQRTNKYTNVVRQYQRLWTKQDEMELLKGYLDYIKQNGRATTSLQNDVASLYDHVRPKLNVGLNKNQLVEKLRRLKRKHKMALDKGKEGTFKSPHEQATFEISHKIWGNDNDMDQDAMDGDELGHAPDNHDDIIGNNQVKVERVDNCDEIDNRASKRPRLMTQDVNRTNNGDNNLDTAAATISMQGFIEDTMKSCFPPLLKELLDDAPEGQLGGLTPISVPSCTGEVGDEQWKKRRILELEMYLNRLESLQDQIKARVEELRSSLA